MFRKKFDPTFLGEQIWFTGHLVAFVFFYLMSYNAPLQNNRLILICASPNDTSNQRRRRRRRRRKRITNTQFTLSTHILESPLPCYCTIWSPPQAKKSTCISIFWPFSIENPGFGQMLSPPPVTVPFRTRGGLKDMG